MDLRSGPFQGCGRRARSPGTQPAACGGTSICGERQVAPDFCLSLRVGHALPRGRFPRPAVRNRERGFRKRQASMASCLLPVSFLSFFFHRCVNRDRSRTVFVLALRRQRVPQAALAGFVCTWLRGQPPTRSRPREGKWKSSRPTAPWERRRFRFRRRAADAGRRGNSNVRKAIPPLGATLRP